MADERVEEAGVQTDTTPAKAKAISFGRLACVLASLALLYFLSSGPVLKLTDNNVILASSIRTFYRPLFFCAYRCPPFGRTLDWYLVKVWRWYPPFD